MLQFHGSRLTPPYAGPGGTVPQTLAGCEQMFFRVDAYYDERQQGLVQGRIFSFHRGVDTEDRQGDAFTGSVPYIEFVVVLVPVEISFYFRIGTDEILQHTPKAVDDVSFSVPQGTKTALVGVSGGGKTTLAKLLPRFWDVDGGSITIGGVNVRDVAPDELTRDVSFVFQNTRLFKTTLLENIMYGNPSASMTDVERAVCMARCGDIVDRLPLGLKTRIGAGGTYLSGGEQQRIALARAILKNAPVVVLDEATAFADPENEHLIQLALRELMKDKTVLMIAHRLPGVTDADEILVVGDGRILERGTHQSLLAGQGAYAGMWNEYMRSVDWKIRRSAGDKGK